jgi:hypothetical protein
MIPLRYRVAEEHDVGNRLIERIADILETRETKYD